MELGILGGTGNAGRALAARLAHTGHSVLLGSRAEAKAEEAVLKIQKLAPKALNVTPRGNQGAALAEVVIIATPAKVAVATAADLETELRGKLVISMCNSLYRSEAGEFFPNMEEMSQQSIAEAIQFAIPKSKVVSAFHHLPAKTLGDLSKPLKNDVLICSDDPGAALQASEIITSIENLRPLNAGGLKNSLAIEAFTAILLNLSFAQKGSASLRITGI